MSPDLNKAVSDAQAEAEMLARRGFPGLAEKMAQQTINALQPIADWASGRITQEQFDTIMAEREAADLAEREAKYGPGPVYEDLNCKECSTTLDAWYRSDHHDEPPSLWPTCEEFTGTDCAERDDEDEDEPS
jgi:hypothetical protein